MPLDLTCQCGCALSASPQHAGLYARCPGCGEVLPVPAPDEILAPAAATPSAVTRRCPDCGEEVRDDEGIACLHCRSMYHQRCYARHEGCIVPTCPVGPASRRHIRRVTAEDTPTQPCPACGQPIPLRAQRCRHCGQFTDATMRAAALRKAPTKTSNTAGLSLIVSVLSALLLSVVESTTMLRLFLLLPLLCIAAGVWAIRDVRRARGEKRGFWAATFAIIASVIGILIWLFRLIK